MSRIPFRIYTFRNPGLVLPEGSTGQEVGAWRYIQGKTEEDIQPIIGTIPENAVGQIPLATTNFLATVSGESLINPLIVYTNDPGYPAALTITVENTIFFIPRTRLDDTVALQAPPVFEFYVNPQRISFNHQKIISEVRTRGGWDVQHWGEKLTEITVEGITGGLHRDGTRSLKPGGYGQSLKPTEDIRDSSAWQRLRTLRLIYDTDHSILATNKRNYKLGFSIYEDFYTGYFQSFNGPEISSDKPYLITFSFTFKVEEKGSLDTIINPSEG